MAELTWQQQLERSDQARRERLVRAEAKYRERIERAEHRPVARVRARPYYPSLPTAGTLGTYWPNVLTNQFRTFANVTTTASTMLNDWGTTMTATANTAYSQDQWYRWVEQNNLREHVARQINYPNVSSDIGHTGWEPAEPTERELWAIAQRRLISRVRSRSFDLRRRVANRAAKRLLLEHLRDDQRREFEQRGWFHVETAEGTRRYRIATGTSGNVVRLDESGRPVTRYCIHPSGVPTYDTMLAQALLLENDEEEFLRVANPSTYVPHSSDYLADAARR